MKKRCPKCNSTLIKHVEGKPLSDNQKIGAVIAGGVVGFLCGGPAGAAAGIPLAHKAGKFLSGMSEISYDECISCGHTF